MGFVEGGNRGWMHGGIRCLTRRKQVDSERTRTGEGKQQLARAISILDLLAIGVGSTIGAGVYVLIGTVAREHSGPSLTISFLIAGIAAALSALCYAELASRCPSAGSAYHYSYICVGEGVAWLIGWALILEYTVGGSAVARGISPNLALFFGGADSLPAFLARVEIPWLGIVVDPCAAILVLAVTALLSAGIKESAVAQAIVTAANVFIMLFVAVVGMYLGYKSGWPGYHVTSGYFPFGVNGMIAGSATVFFSYIGFDSVACTAEEVKDPRRDLPLGIGLSLSICCGLYMMVSAVVVGLVPYFSMNPDTPISSAFASHGFQWAMYIVTVGAIFALCATLMGSLLPQPRILMAMSRDGLLPTFFCDVNKKTQVPIKGTTASGVCAAALAFIMDVDELAGMVSVGTLLAFTVVAVSILILRYVPPNEVPLPSSLHESIHSVTLRYNSQENCIENQECDTSNELEGENTQVPLIGGKSGQDNELRRRKIAALSITFLCVGNVILTSALSIQHLARSALITLSIIGGLLVFGPLGALYAIEQDDDRHSFGHAGGFTCPFVPMVPICSILINTYMLINLGVSTWWKVSLWLALGVVVYIFYGRKNSQLVDVVYVPRAHVEEIYKTSSEASR